MRPRTLGFGLRRFWSSWLGDSPKPRSRVKGKKAFSSAVLCVESLEARVVPSGDGQTLVPQLLKDINTAPAEEASSNPYLFTLLNGQAVFQATDATHGTELWITDGTTEGTRLLKDVNPGTASGMPQNLIAIGNTLYFTAIDATHGRELWKTDGTEVGTVLVADLKSGKGNTKFKELVELNGSLLLVTADSLYRSNGTTAGTTLIQGGLATTKELITIGDTAYFSTGSGVYRTDGTAAGTQLALSATGVASLTDFNGSLYFTGTVPGYSGLMSLNGNRPINPSYVSRIGALRVVNNLLYFQANYSGSHAELWVTDGTSAVQLLGNYRTRVREFPGVAVVGELDGKAFYFSGDGCGFTDGTNDGTTFFPGEGPAGWVLNHSSDPVVLGSDLIYGNSELMKTSGLSVLGQQIRNISPSGSSYPQCLFRFGDRVLFSADDGVHGRELWITDGTEAGTTLLRDINNDGTRSSLIRGDWPPNSASVEMNGQLYFPVRDVTGGWELWRTNGTTVGTTPVTTLPGQSRGIFDLTQSGNRIFFCEGAEERDRYKLWGTDGVTTTLLLEGLTGGDYHAPVAANGTLYFRHDSGIWTSDGTAAGTRSVLNNASPHEMFFVGEQVFFTERVGDKFKLSRLNGNTSEVIDNSAEWFAPLGNRILEYTNYSSGMGELWAIDATGGGRTLLGSLPYSSAAPAVIRGDCMVFSLGSTYLLDSSNWSLRQVSNKELYFAQVMNGALYGLNFANSARDLWRVDLASGAETKIGTIGSSNDHIQSTFLADGQLFYATSSTDHIGGLWTSDGTAAGTRSLAVTQPLSTDSALFGKFSLVNGRVFLPISTLEFGMEPWVIPLGSSAEFRLPDTATDAFELLREGDNLVLKSGMEIVATFPASSSGRWTLIGSERNETLTVNFANGNPLPAGSLDFQAGGTTDADRLILKSGSMTAVNLALSAADAGTLTIGGAAVQFSGISAVDDQLTASARTFSFTSGKDTLALQDDGTARNNRSQIIRGAMSLTFTHPTASLNMNLGMGADVLRVRSIDASASGVITVDAGEGNDTVTGGRLAMNVLGGAGADSLTGGIASDTLQGGVGNDSLLGGGGNDQLDGGDGDDTMNGGAGDDVLLGGAGNDLAIGGAGNDYINGNSGRDTVTAGGEGSPLGPEDVIADTLAEIRNDLAFTADWIAAT